MGPRRTLVILAAAFLGAAILALCFAPILIASGLRWWAQRATAREGVTLNLGEIDAPLLRPVVVTNLHAVTAPGAPFRVECTAARLEFDLNLYGILTGSRRSLRALTIEGLNLDIRRDLKVTDSARRIPWSFLENLLADSFKFSGLQVHVESGGTTFDLNGGGLSGSEMETGVLTARQISVAAPWFRKDFANVRGATSWQETRLAIGAINLMRGLDVDNIIIDLSHIGRSQIGMELSVDAFGGKLRARVASDDRANVRTWDIAGSGSGVSLAQMSDALDWSNRASGTLHGTKFTFRGATTDLRNATASIWAEVTGLTWRDRTADTVMIGASVYNREVQVEHLYIKQRSNELNFNGEFAWPEKSADWIKPAFHGDILASINDLGDFARLFGQTPADFGGKLSAKGHVSAEGGKLGGQLSVTGNSLIVLRSEIDSLELNLELKESQLAVTRLDLRRDVDFLRAEGTFALNNRGLWTGSLQTSVGDLANYRGFIPRVFARLEPAGGFEVTWKSAPDSGAVEIRSRNARLGAPATAAFEAAIDVEYSANTTFFRQLHVWNSRSDLRGFLTLANDYIHLQELRFDLNGRRCLEGDVFLPVSFQRLRGTGEWLASLTDDPFFDVNLKLEESDMAEIAAAVSAFPSMSGRAAGRLQLSGTPGSLQGNAVFQSRDLVTEASPAMRAALELRLALGIANLKADLAIGGSAVVVDAAFPLQLERTSSGHEFRKTGPISASIKFPALFLARLPRYLTREIFTRGILTGGVNIADTLEEPLITGNLNLIAAQVLGGPELSGAMTFKGREATIDFAHVERDDADILLRGQINFQNLEAIGITLLPNTVLAESPGLFQGDCVSKIELAAQPLERSAAAAIDQIKLRGNLFAQTWTISLSNGLAPDLPEGELGRVFSFCADGKTLTLGVQPSLFP